MTLMGNFDFNYLVEVDQLMAQMLCGSYFSLASVVCINLYMHCYQILFHVFTRRRTQMLYVIRPHAIGRGKRSA